MRERIADDQGLCTPRRYNCSKACPSKTRERDSSSQIDLRLGLVLEEGDIDVVDIVLQAQPSQLGTIIARRLQSIREIYRRCIKLRRVRRRELRRPFGAARLLKDQNLQIIFRNRDCLNRRVQCGLTVGELSLHLSPLERGFGAGRDLCLDVSQALTRKIQVRELVLLVA